MEELHMSTGSHSGFFSSDLLPSLGARINQATKLRRHIVSPFDPHYRAWEMFLILLVIYSAWISPFEFAFLSYKQDVLFIFDNIVNSFFAVDIVLTFFVAYLDSQSYLLIDDPKRIAIRYVSTWFTFDVCSTVPFQSLSLLFTDHNGGLGFKLLSMLRLWRLRRVSSLFTRLEKDIRFNYFWTRCTKLIADYMGKVNGQDQIIGKASTGEIFGEIGVLCGKPQPFGVRTTEVSQLLRLNTTTFLNIIRANPEDERIVMNNLFQKLKVWRGFDIEGQEDPSLILKNWLGREPKRECNSHTEDHDNLYGDSFDQKSTKDVSGSRFMVTNQSGTEVDAISSAAEDGQTALHTAVRQGHLEMVRILLDTGGNVNKLNERCQLTKELEEHHANKGIYDLMQNYENEKKLVGTSNSGTNRYKKDANPSSSSSKHPTGVEATKSVKRVTIHMNFQKQNDTRKQLAKLIILPDSLEELLKIAGQKFGDGNLTKVLDAENAEIDDLSVIRDGDHLFLVPNLCEDTSWCRLSDIKDYRNA
ncbi:Potassium channel KAT2 [Sesamum angolense]|uniref:Potassium channel n=1 Tax=Sesamum angolense TaxID=2727404 RepID=A0AAE2BIE5_9LAMI|nr:Potassium channel KAT2 [Sesamum angolense]